MNRFFAYYMVGISLILLISCRTESEQIEVIPKPLKGCVNFRKALKIDSLTLFGMNTSNLICCLVDSTNRELGEEGYELTVDAGGVRILSGGEAGLFYGKMTLKQLYAEGKLPYLHIIDKPRFPYRGVMLDVSRHFFTKEEIKRLLDRMSQYKLNRFHWHLTDDGGWRIQIDSYPELTRQAAFRTDWNWKEWWGNGAKFVSEEEWVKYGGFYTKEDIREIVQYASERFITVIPEIEFPGHSREVFVAYPQLCCAAKPYMGNTYCVGGDSTYVFMEKVLNEVMDLFPSEFIHIGGDETNLGPWKECGKCQSLMKKEGMQDTHELHEYIIGKAEEIIGHNGRRMMGWDEIACEHLDKSSAIMSWRGEEAGMVAAGKGYEVVLSPLDYLYLDYFQGNPSKEPFAHDGYTTLEKVYSYNPLPDSVTDAVRLNVLGIQGNLWSEWIPDEKQLEYMAFPRLLAVAEVAWSAQSVRDWNDFRDRVISQLDGLSRRGVNARPLSTDIEYVMNVEKDVMTVALECECKDVEIHYTTDGSEPSAYDDLYVSPLMVEDSLLLCAAAFKGENKVGDIYSHCFYKHKAIGTKVVSFPHLKSVTALVDGYIGGYTYLEDTWVNFSGDREFILDLGYVKDLSKIVTRWMQLRAGARRYLPKVVEVMFSQDGVSYVTGGVALQEQLMTASVLQFQNFVLAGHWKARYVKLKVVGGEGGMSLDEIIVL